MAFNRAISKIRLHTGGEHKGKTEIIDYHELRPVAQITGDRYTRPKGVWTAELLDGKEESDIFVTCPLCGAVGNLSDHGIDCIGRADPCIVCPGCKTHVFVRLRRWNKGHRREANVPPEIQFVKTPCRWCKGTYMRPEEKNFIWEKE